MMYLFHFLTIPGYFILKGLPVVCYVFARLWVMFPTYGLVFVKGLVVSLLTTGILTTTQTLAMRLPLIRRALGMPVYVPPRLDGPSIFGELKTLLSKGGDVKVKVARARREAATRKKNTEQPISKGR
jgi:hypothetical protein